MGALIDGDRFSRRKQEIAEGTTPKKKPSLQYLNDLFAKAVLAEENRRFLEAEHLYQELIELDPDYAAAYVNLGTLLYNSGDYAAAEPHYRKAIEIDPRYALAHFDLGNTLDETGRCNAAIESYKTALALAPNYADAHYNLALAYEKMRDLRKALPHWKKYVKLQPSGPWTTHAKTQIRRILGTDILKLVPNEPEDPTSFP